VRLLQSPPRLFCSLGSAVLADLELATSTIALPAQAAALHPGRGCALPLPIWAAYLKLTAGAFRINR